MSDIHSRLIEARKNAGFATAQEAAAAMGIAYPTYAAHENGSSGIRVPVAERYAKRFRVSVDWLVSGRGDARAGLPAEIPVMGYVGAGAEVEPEFEQVPPDGLFQITVPFPMPADMIAYQVKGDSMLPQFHDGMIIVVFKEQRRSTDSFLGEEAVVRTADGRRFVKTIERSGDGGYTLRSWNAKPIERVSLDWVGEIFTYLPATSIKREGRRVEKQGGLQGQLRLRAG